MSLVEDSIRKAQAATENAHNQIRTLIENLEGYLAASARKKLTELPSPQIAEFTRTLGRELHIATEDEKAAGQRKHE